MDETQLLSHTDAQRGRVFLVVAAFLRGQFSSIIDPLRVGSYGRRGLRIFLFLHSRKQGFSCFALRQIENLARLLLRFVERRKRFRIVGRDAHRRMLQEPCVFFRILSFFEEFPFALPLLDDVADAAALLLRGLFMAIDIDFPARFDGFDEIPRGSAAERRKEGDAEEDTDRQTKCFHEKKGKDDGWIVRDLLISCKKVP